MVVFYCNGKLPFLICLELDQVGSADTIEFLDLV